MRELDIVPSDQRKWLEENGCVAIIDDTLMDMGIKAYTNKDIKEFPPLDQLLGGLPREWVSVGKSFIFSIYQRKY